jgi:phosphoribosylformylglycinamidine synthase
MGQSNSEHSRHWFFGGKIIIDGKEMPDTLFKMVKDTLPKDKPNNSIIAFFDNSRAIRGYPITTLIPEKPGMPSRMIPYSQTFHPTLTAETHNFPTGVAPFPGAETGTGGRLRDVQGKDDE